LGPKKAPDGLNSGPFLIVDWS